MKKLNLIGNVGTWEDINEYLVINFLSSLSPNEEFEVYINSPGGSVFTGISIFNLLKPYNPKIYVLSLAASIASVIACAGQIKMLPGSTLMIHNPWALDWGDANYKRKLANDLDKIKGQIIEIYRTKSNLSEKALSDLMDNETWMTAKETINAGFASEEVDEVSGIDSKIHSNMNKVYYSQFVAELKKQNEKEDENINNQQKGVDMPDNKVELEALQNQLANAQKLNEENLAKIEALKNSISEKETLITQIQSEFAEQKKINEETQAKLKVLSEAYALTEETRVKNEVIAVVEQLHKENKILTAEKEDEIDILLNFKKTDEAKFNKRIETIKARTTTDLTQEFAVRDMKESVGTFNVSTLEDRAKLTEAVMKLSAEKKISFEQAYEELIKGGK